MKGKKILILGNGFDLAHGLSTNYLDFLKFDYIFFMIAEKWISVFTSYANKEIKYYWKNYWKEDMDDNLTNNSKETLKTLFGEEELNKFSEIIYSRKGNKSTKINFNNRNFQNLYEYLSDNIWIEYFTQIYQREKIRGKNWVDFELEMSYIVCCIDKFSENLLRPFKDLSEELNKQIEYPAKLWQFNNALNYMEDVKENKIQTIRDLRKKCFKDLERLVYALEIYLLEMIEEKNIEKLDIIENIHPDYIINFNYTHTYERLYGNEENVFHIHGKCRKTNEEKTKKDNMVLGIDEYWSKEECDQHTNYAIFKKFVQRIRKKTGTKHIEWLNKINNIYQDDKENGISDIYIFGHSLDITDKDILQDFFTSEATRIHIYCKDAETEGELIANVIKLMGEKNLLQKVNQEVPKIEFIIQ